MEYNVKILFGSSENWENRIFLNDYITKTLLQLIEDNKLNDNPKWISFKELYETQKLIITKYENDINDKEIENLIWKLWKII